MKNIRLFQPPETHDCSYLTDQRSRSLYVDPRTDLDIDGLTLLNLHGFRRSGRIVYRPSCPQCNACTSVRIRVNEFSFSRSQRRIMKKNADLTLSITPPDDQKETYQLYDRYISQRHYDGDMFPPSHPQFEDFLLTHFGTSRFLLAHLNDELIGCMVFDILNDGLSSVYCFYSPDAEKRSLGTFMILQLNQIARNLGLSFNYLGYFVSGSQKMEYKRQFLPLEAYRKGHWQLISC